MAIYKYLDCSTGNITQKDSEILQDMAEDGGPLIVLQYEYGYVLSMPSDKDYLAEYIKIAKEDGLSDSFIKIVRHAFKNDCLKLVLDQDGDYLPRFKKHDW